MRLRTAKPTRLFTLATAGVLLAGLGAGLVASYALGSQFTRFRGDGPDELAYVPGGPRLVAFVNLRGVPDGDSRHRIARLASGRGGLSHLRANTGIDIDRDIDRLIAAVPGRPQGHSGRPLLLARGRFDRPRIEKAVERQGGTAEDYRGTRLLAHPGADLGLAFLEPDLVALGSPASVRRALDVGAGASAGMRRDDDLMRQVRQVQGGHAWVVVRFDTAPVPLGPRASGPIPGFPPLNGLTWLAARGHVNGAIHATIRAQATDEQAAENMRDVIRAAAAHGRRRARPPLATVIDSLELGGNGRTVTLGFAVPLEMLETIRPPAPPPFGVEPPAARRQDRLRGPGARPQRRDPGVRAALHAAVVSY